MRTFYKLMAWIIGIAFFAQFMAGSEISWNYSHSRAVKVKQSFWGNTLKLARNVGDFTKALKGGD